MIKRVNKVLLKMSISQGHSYLVIGAQAEVCKFNNIRSSSLLLRWESLEKVLSSFGTDSTTLTSQ